jgi:Raf kinase inhibitor-like YbhB/YbcL family protein
MSMKLTSSAFKEGEAVPTRYTCDGDDISPPLAWSGAPENTRSFVVMCDDPDAPGGTWSHWAVYDIPASTTQLAEAYPKDADTGTAKQAVNDFGRTGYGGPCPPPGHGTHHYHFRVVAVDVENLGLDAGADFDQVAKQAAAHSLDIGQLLGTYTRR